MRFYSNSVFCLFLSASLLSGCNQSPQKPTIDKSASTASSVVSLSSNPVTVTSATLTTEQNTTQNNVKETDTANALLTVLSGLTFKSFNENPKQKLTTDQKSCLEKADYQAFLPNFQRYLQSKLTADELTKTNQFYALPVGQKQIQLANQQLHTAKGEKVSNSITLTDDETLQMQAFQDTPEGHKLSQLLSPQNQPELEKVLTEPMAINVMADCHIQSSEIAALEKVISSASSTKP